MKNKRNYGRYLSIFFPDLEKTNKKKFYNKNGREITKTEYKRILEIEGLMRELTNEYNKLNN